MAEVDTSTYPRPQPPQNPLQTITQLGQVMDTLGNVEVGKAMQQAIKPDGTVDRNALAQILKGSTVGSMKALPALDALEKLRQAGFAADQSGLETFQKRMALTNRLFTHLASKPSPTMRDVNDIAAKALDPNLDAGKFGITLPVVMNAVKNFRGMNSQQIRQKALELATQAQQSMDAIHPHVPKGQWINRGGKWTFVPVGTEINPALGTDVSTSLPPGTVVRGPNNAPTYLGEQPPGAPFEGVTAPPPGAPLRAPPAGPIGRAAPLPRTPIPTGPREGLAPGQQEAASGMGVQAAASGNELTKAADGTNTRLAMLGNLEHDLGKFTAGPGADWTRVGKAWVNRNIPLPPGWQFDPKSIASQEEFNKQAAMLAQAQFQAIGGTGTDSKFDSAFKTSPNETLSQLGNKGIIRLLKGNEDAIRAKNEAWLRWLEEGNPENSYQRFSYRFNQHFDPRVFQFRYLSPKERQDYVNGLDADEQGDFLRNLTYATKEGWVKYEPPKGGRK